MEHKKQQKSQKRRAEEAAQQKSRRKSKKVDFAAVYKEAITELDKAKEGKEVDFEMVTNFYEKISKPLVQSHNLRVFEA